MGAQGQELIHLNLVTPVCSSGLQFWHPRCCLCSRWLGSLLECLRKASIYRSLGVGKRHVVESNRWHMSQLDWSTYVITYIRWIACVIAYTCWTTYVIAYTRWCVIGFLHDTWQIFVGFWVVIGKPSNNTWRFVICCILWTW